MSKKLTNKTAQFHVSSLTIALRISLFLNSNESCWHNMKKSHLHLQDAIFDKELVWFHFSQDQPQLRNVVCIQQHGSLRIMSNFQLKPRDYFKISIKVLHWKIQNLNPQLQRTRLIPATNIRNKTSFHSLHPGTYF